MLWNNLFNDYFLSLDHFNYLKNFKVASMILDYVLLCDSCQFPVSGSWNSNMTSRLRVLISACGPELDGWMKRGQMDSGRMEGWTDVWTDG